MTEHSARSDAELMRGDSPPSANAPNGLIKYVQHAWSKFGDEHRDNVCHFNIPRPIDAVVEEMFGGVAFELGPIPRVLTGGGLLAVHEAEQQFSQGKEEKRLIGWDIDDDKLYIAEALALIPKGPILFAHGISDLYQSVFSSREELCHPGDP